MELAVGCTKGTYELNLEGLDSLIGCVDSVVVWFNQLECYLLWGEVSLDCVGCLHERLEQRVTTANIPTMTPLPEIQRVSNAPPTMVANNPTSKRIMQNKTRTHKRATRRNMPGTLPHIGRPLYLSTEVPFQIPVRKSTHSGTKSEQQPQRACHDDQQDSPARTTMYNFVTHASSARRQ